MSRWIFVSFVFVLCLAGCKKPKPPWRQIAVVPPAAPQVAPEPPRAPPIEERIVDGMGLTIRARRQDSGSVEFVVANAARQSIHVRSVLTLERKSEGDFRAVEPTTAISLQHDCESPPPDCTELVPGAEWFPRRTTVRAGSRPCAEEHDGAELHGELRFVAMSCDGTTRYVGEPFRH